MENAKVGFIGCGTHASNNIYPMLRYSRCKLEAVCDLDEELARRNASIFGDGAHFYTDYNKMLDENKFDGVFVVLPFNLHYEVSKNVLSRGMNLFVEKPPSADLEKVQELVDIARSNNAFIMTAFMKRHGMTYKKAKELITSGQFELHSGFFKYAHWASTDLRSMLLGMSIHIIDLAISFFGDVDSVHSNQFNNGRSISVGVTLKFKSGKWAQLMLDSSQPRIQERVELSGYMDGGNSLIIVDNVDHIELHTSKNSTQGIDIVVPNLYEIDPFVFLDDIRLWRPDYGLPNMGQTRHFFQGYAGEVREFADAIIENREPYPGTEDSTKAMRVIEAICNNPDGVTCFS